MNDLEKRWGKYLITQEDAIKTTLLRAIESASQSGLAIITVKKDRSGGYRFRNKLWCDVDQKERVILEDDLRYIGAAGPFGGS